MAIEARPVPLEGLAGKAFPAGALYAGAERDVPEALAFSIGRPIEEGWRGAASPCLPDVVLHGSFDLAASVVVCVTFFGDFE